MIGSLQRGQLGEKNSSSSWIATLSITMLCFLSGWGVGYIFKDSLFSIDHSNATALSLAHASHHGLDIQIGKSSAKAGLNAGDLPSLLHASSACTIAPTDISMRDTGLTVHTLVTSSGDGYQNFQTRILYSSYQIVQKMPGGELMTGFTRILHRTVPDILMKEVPTFHVWDVLKPQCDGWCDYPVANRPNAILQFFEAVAKNRSMINGAWILMAECDYVFMVPVRIPGDAFDKSVPGHQYHFDYIIPSHPDAAPHIIKLYGQGKKVTDVPASGPAPVILRFEDWLVLVPEYNRLSIEMEKDEPMKKQLGWVREMYAWDVACALHQEIKILTQKPPHSILMVQPPFDEGMFNASFCHYTWGALYHEGLPSKGGKQVYRWEKRDYTDIKHAIKVPHIPMPPEFKEGWTLEFDAPLTLVRHNLIVKFLTQLNKAIDPLTDLTEYHKKVEAEIIPAFRATLKERQEARHHSTFKMKFMPWSLPPKDTEV